MAIASVRISPYRRRVAFAYLRWKVSVWPQLCQPWLYLWLPCCMVRAAGLWLFLILAVMALVIAVAVFGVPGVARLVAGRAFGSILGGQRCL